MAKEEKTPSFINYEEDPQADSATRWTHTAFKKHWYRVYVKAVKAKPRWGIKETTLLTKLMREYDAEVLAEMIKIAASSGISFTSFYMEAPKWHQKYREETAEWEWN